MVLITFISFILYLEIVVGTMYWIGCMLRDHYVKFAWIIKENAKMSYICHKKENFWKSKPQDLLIIDFILF